MIPWVGGIMCLGLNPAATGLGIRPWSVVWVEASGSSVRRDGPARVYARVRLFVHVGVSACVHLEP